MVVRAADLCPVDGLHGICAWFVHPKHQPIKLQPLQGKSHALLKDLVPAMAPSMAVAFTGFQACVTPRT